MFEHAPKEEKMLEISASSQNPELARDAVPYFLFKRHYDGAGLAFEIGHPHLNRRSARYAARVILENQGAVRLMMHEWVTSEFANRNLPDLRLHLGTLGGQQDAIGGMSRVVSPRSQTMLPQSERAGAATAERFREGGLALPEVAQTVESLKADLIVFLQKQEAKPGRRAPARALHRMLVNAHHINIVEAAIDYLRRRDSG